MWYAYLKFVLVPPPPPEKVESIPAPLPPQLPPPLPPPPPVALPREPGNYCGRTERSICSFCSLAGANLYISLPILIFINLHDYNKDFYTVFASVHLD